jgi:hypothetical protein
MSRKMKTVQWVASIAGMDFDANASLEHTTCGVLCMEEIGGVVGSGSYMKGRQGNGDGDGYEAESKPLPSFMEALFCLSQGEHSCILTSPKETKRTLLT